jgi:hypothetical protein
MSVTETEARLTDRLSRLADYAATEPTRSLVARTSVLLDLEPVRRRSRIPATVAAAVVTFAVIGSVVVVAEGSDTGPRAGVTATSPSGQPLSFDQGPKVPDVQLTGWTRASVTSELAAPGQAGKELFVVLTPDPVTLDGEHIFIGIAVAPDGFSAGPNPTSVDIDGTPGKLGTITDPAGKTKVVVVWSPAPGRTMFVEGQDTTAERVLGVARGLNVNGSLEAVTVNAGAIPEGLQLTPAGRVSTDPVTATEFHFTRTGADFEVKLFPGGRETMDDQLSGPTRPVTVWGKQGELRTDADGYFTLFFVDGRWAAKIAGGPFVSEQAFFEAVESLTITPAG